MRRLKKLLNQMSSTSVTLRDSSCFEDKKAKVKIVESVSESSSS